MCLSFAALTVWTSPAKPAKWMHVLAGGLVAYAALFTGSRKMLLVLAIVGFVALGWMARRMKRASSWLIFAGVAVVAVLAACLVGPRLLQMGSTVGSARSFARFDASSAGNTLRKKPLESR